MLLGFKPRFEEPILLGTKVFTLRSRRKNLPKIGERLFMYSGLRTENCKKISDRETLMGMQEAMVYISRNANAEIKISISVDNRMLSESEIDDFVKFDGFRDRKDFANYWIDSSHKPRKAPKECTVGGNMDLYHWTDLKY